MSASFADHERVSPGAAFEWLGIQPISPAKLNRLKPTTEISDTTELALPRGFRYGAAKAGLKRSGRPDFALIVADAPSSAAAAFTANRVTAAPLVVDKEHLRASGARVRVIAINAGNANCAAGQAGLDAARATCEAAAQLFGCRAEEVLDVYKRQLRACPTALHFAAKRLLAAARGTFDRLPLAICPALRRARR